MILTETELREATPLNRLVCRSNGVTVGIEYRWNTGEVGVLWRDEVFEDTLRVPIEKRNRESG